MNQREKHTQWIEHYRDQTDFQREEDPDNEFLDNVSRQLTKSIHFRRYVDARVKEFRENGHHLESV